MKKYKSKIYFKYFLKIFLNIIQNGIRWTFKSGFKCVQE